MTSRETFRKLKQRPFEELSAELAKILNKYRSLISVLVLAAEDYEAETLRKACASNIKKTIKKMGWTEQEYKDESKRRNTPK